MDEELKTAEEKPGANKTRPAFNEVLVLFPLLTFYTAGYLGMMVADFFLKCIVKPNDSMVIPNI
jgi:hypothetical protein